MPDHILKIFGYINISVHYKKVMEYNENKIEGYINQAIGNIQSKHNAKVTQKLDYFVIVDTNYSHPSIAKSSGFISTQDNLLVSYLKIDISRISNFSEKLVEFIIAHELCHSLNNKISVDSNSFLTCVIQKIKSRELNKIMSIEDLKNNPDDKQFIEYISGGKLFNSENETKDHKCIDLCAREILNLGHKEFIEILEEFYENLNGDKELLGRLNAAKAEDYEDCR